MREDVPFKKLGDVCIVTGGGTPSKKRDDFYGGEIPWATVRDMNYDVLEETDHRITVLGLENSSANVIPKDNIVIATRVGLGKVCKLKQDTAINQDLKGIIPKNDDLITDYLFLWFKSISDKIIEAGTGATVQGVKIPFVKNLKIPIPPLPEQKRIVEILDEAFEAIDQARANVDRNIQNGEEMFQSKLNEIFSQSGDGWEEKRLDQVCENLDRMRDPISKKNRKEGPYPYYGASGIVDYIDDYIFDEDLLLVSEDGANLLARTYPIAFSISGKNWVNNHAHVLRFEDLGSQKFIEYYLNSIKLDPWVSGMAQPKLNQGNLNSIPVPFPSIEEQKRFVNGLDILKKDVESIEVTYKNKVEALEELKKSILQKAFSGELTAGESGFAGLEDQQDGEVARAAESNLEYETD